MLSRKIAIVTGADAGTGRATAVLFAQQGADAGTSYHSDADAPSPSGLTVNWDGA